MDFVHEEQGVEEKGEWDVEDKGKAG